MLVVGHGDVRRSRIFGEYEARRGLHAGALLEGQGPGSDLLSFPPSEQVVQVDLRTAWSCRGCPRSRMTVSRDNVSVKGQCRDLSRGNC